MTLPATIAPVRPAEVVQWATSALHQSDLMQGVDAVYAHTEPEPHAERYATVMQLRLTGGSEWQPLGMRLVRFQVRVECPEKQPNPETFHAQAHQFIRRALVGQRPNIVHGQNLGPVEQDRQPDTPMFDAADLSWYSVSGYRTLYTPNGGYNA